MTNGFNYEDANWDYIDLPKRLERVLRCGIKDIDNNKISMECSHLGFWASQSKCSLDIEKKNNKIKVILTEPPDNKGTSITNVYEHLATMIYHQFLFKTSIKNIEWFEHYPENKKTNHEETLDRVEMLWDDERFSNPKWSRIK